MSEVSHVWSKLNHANNLKTFAKASEKWRYARKCREWEEEVIQKIWLFQLCCVNKCKTKKRRQTTKQKNIAGQVLMYNSKNFHWLNRKLDLERTMNGLRKPFRKKIRSKKSKKQKKSKRNCRMWTKIRFIGSGFLFTCGNFALIFSVFSIFWIGFFSL